MTSQYQIDANRLNAQKSTGPISPEGKSTCVHNALKPGIDAESIVLNTENRADFEDLAIRYYAQFSPGNEQERTLVEALITSEWLRRRYLQVEAALWNTGLEGRNPSLSAAYAETEGLLSRVDRLLNSAIRSYTHVLEQLLQLQSSNPTPPESAPESGLFLISGFSGLSEPTGESDNAATPIAA